MQNIRFWVDYYCFNDLKEQNPDKYGSDILNESVMIRIDSALGFKSSFNMLKYEELEHR